MDQLTGLVDKAGNEHNMSSYAEMLSQEATIQSYRQGSLNGMVESGVLVGQISEGHSGNTCGACDEWAGRVVSILRDIPGIPSVEEAITAGVFHVNCIHTINPLVDLGYDDILKKYGKVGEMTAEQEA